VSLRPHLALAFLLVPVSRAQETVEQRLDRVEAENAELRRRFDLLAGDVEHFSLAQSFAPLGNSVSGLGLAASKVYDSAPGVALGGYGEANYTNASAGDDTADLLRAVLYVGYEFDSTWLFNSEFEFEHGSTERNGAASVEFAYIDGRFDPTFNMRTGLVLVPMGLTNEMHEPTAFPSVMRPDVERVILPTTWSDIGAGAWGCVGDFSYRTYIVNALDAANFDAADGLQEGKQLGSEAIANDWAWVGRVDYAAAPDVIVGGSLYFGNSGQELGPAVGTTIWEAHADTRWRGAHLRALYAMANLDDVTDLNASLGLAGNQSIGEQLDGYYVELGYDVMSVVRPGSQQSLEPFVRYESYDTQAQVPSGFSSDPANDVDSVTFGLAYKPIDNIVFKVDYQDYDNGSHDATDFFHVGMGFIF
jgi:hypothetical protein